MSLLGALEWLLGLAALASAACVALGMCAVSGRISRQEERDELWRRLHGETP